MITPNETSQKLLDFIKSSPSSFHAAATAAKKLDEQSFVRLDESAEWTLDKGGKYYVTRNSSAILAFVIPDEPDGGFMIAAAHDDSPSFKLKPNLELDGPDGYTRINAERYGGAMLDTWFDRPLSVAGRVILRETDGGRTRFTEKLVDFDRDLVMIPHVAPHMMNPADMKSNLAVDLVPLYGIGAKGKFLASLAELAGADEDKIAAYDLFLYNRQNQSIWGADNEFISSPKLDDLQCVFCALEAICDAEAKTSIPVMYISDNEEVGCVSRQGANSDLLSFTLARISRALGRSESEHMRALASSMMMSADNAHAVHPNHAELADPTHRPHMNKGIVMKYNSALLYTSDSLSGAIMTEICRRENVPLQLFCNRSDIRGGSTLGVASSTQLSVMSVDVGIAQLAMHSSYETAGSLDTGYMINAMRGFYQSSLSVSYNHVELI